MTDVYRPDTPRRRGDHTAPHVSPVTPAEDVRTVLINKVSWGAVLAGVAVALVTHLILNMLGVGIGAATLDPGTGDNPSASTFSIGAAIWFAVAGILAALAGGVAAGRLSGQPKENTAGWHGLASWAVTTLIVFLLLSTTLGSILGGAYRGLANVAGTLTDKTAQLAAPAIAQAGDPFASIDQAIRARTGGEDPAMLRDAAIAAVRAAVTGDPQQANEARERATQALARAQNISPDEARGEIERYEQQYRQSIERAREQATQVADAAAKGTSRAALLGAISLLIGAAAGWFGGRMGAIDPTVTPTVA